MASVEVLDISRERVHSAMASWQPVRPRASEAASKDSVTSRAVPRTAAGPPSGPMIGQAVTWMCCFVWSCFSRMMTSCDGRPEMSARWVSSLRAKPVSGGKRSASVLPRMLPGSSPIRPAQAWLAHT